MAPDPGHLLATTDDTRSLAIAARHPCLRVERDPEAALVVTGPQEDVSAYVAAIARAGIDLLALNQTQTPLEALFFMLTDDSTHQALTRPSELTRAVR
jgi:ABC-2 type transport system ATP-binding protein